MILSSLRVERSVDSSGLALLTECQLHSDSPAINMSLYGVKSDQKKKENEK